jgi:hypothetical protein
VSIKVRERKRAKFSFSVKNVKISQLEEEKELQKFGKNKKILKSYFTKQTVALSKMVIF